MLPAAIRDILDSLASRPEHAHSGYEEQNDSTSHAQSIIDHHKHGERHLDEMPRAVYLCEDTSLIHERRIINALPFSILRIA